jgi:isopenicillin-N N-acyltransferase-like protein
MRILSLQGNHYQMGFQHGEQVTDLRAQIIARMDARLGHLERRDDVSRSLQRVEVAWKRSTRSTLAMVQGIADALKIPFARLFLYALASYLDDLAAARRATEGCTVWAASGNATRDGTPILTKNRDYSLAHLPLQLLAHATPQRGYRHLYVTSAGSPGVFSSGMNEKGLAVADTHVISRDIGAGLARYTLMMKILEEHATVASALRYLRQAKHMGAGNLVLADARGCLAVCESGYARCGFGARGENLVVATNHFVSPVLRNAYVENSVEDSRARFETARAEVMRQRGRMDVERAKAVMARHANGSTAICRHDANEVWATISNVIFLPSEHKIFFCNGRPCASTYEQVAV